MKPDSVMQGFYQTSPKGVEELKDNKPRAYCPWCVHYLARIKELEDGIEKIYEYSSPGDTPEIDRIITKLLEKK
mgnify:CR=1 FL=1